MPVEYDECTCVIVQVKIEAALWYGKSRQLGRLPLLVKQLTKQVFEDATDAAAQAAASTL
jgi:hypothetical protein